MSQAYYLVEEKEADLIATLLCPLCPTQDRGTADRIVCDLIELGLCDMDGGPAVFTAWVNMGEYDGMNDAERIEALVKAYKACDWCGKHGHAREACPDDQDEED